jgi:hypothetical protein
VFVQADASLPFYKLTARNYPASNAITTTNRRYVPSLVFSVGLAWQKNRR